MDLDRMLDRPFWNEMKIEFVTEDRPDNESHLKDQLDRVIRHKNVSELLLCPSDSLETIKHYLISYFFKSYLLHLSPIVVMNGSRVSSPTHFNIIKGLCKRLEGERNIQVIIDLIQSIANSPEYEVKIAAPLDEEPFLEFIEKLGLDRR